MAAVNAMPVSVKDHVRRGRAKKKKKVRCLLRVPYEQAALSVDAAASVCHGNVVRIVRGAVESDDLDTHCSVTSLSGWSLYRVYVGLNGAQRER